VPSGDRRVAGLWVDALERVADHIELVSTFRSFDGDGDSVRQQALRAQGATHAARLVSGWRSAPPEMRPTVWFTYHVYYKAPDWLGPAVSAALGIPYVIAEASYAEKRAGGPWAIGHAAAAEAIEQARLVLSPSRDDVAGLQALIPKERIVHLPPFLDAEVYRAAGKNRRQHRERLARERGLDPAVPWIVVAAMMRAGDKVASYLELAQALAPVTDLPWRLVVAGDGSGRAEVESALERAAPGRTCFLGTLEAREVAAIYAACDLYAWPAVNEAYGMSLLEAQAAGVPVVSRPVRGVPDVVMDGRTGLLTPDLTAGLRALLSDAKRREALGREAAVFIHKERSLDAAAQRLGKLLAAL
jgi:glycosyltransferase involved in cell wall biosynthesis